MQQRRATITRPELGVEDSFLHRQKKKETKQKKIVAFCHEDDDDVFALAAVALRFCARKMQWRKFRSAFTFCRCFPLFCCRQCTHKHNRVFAIVSQLLLSLNNELMYFEKSSEIVHNLRHSHGKEVSTRQSTTKTSEKIYSFSFRILFSPFALFFFFPLAVRLTRIQTLAVSINISSVLCVSFTRRWRRFNVVHPRHRIDFY